LTLDDNEGRNAIAANAVPDKAQVAIDH